MSYERLALDVSLLPDDLIFDILTRLPPRTLLKFQTVSKSWRSQIRHPVFIHNHLSHFRKHSSLQNNDDDSSGFVVRRVQEEYGNELSLVEDGNYLTVHEYVTSTTSRYYICGSCNGLFCYASEDSDKEIELRNPSIRYTHLVPPCPFALDGEYRCYGVGFDQPANDYKVLKLDSKGTAIYSVNAESWKTVNASVPAKHMYGLSIFLRGFIHWLVKPYDNNNNDDHQIMWFDVGKESFGVMQLPEEDKRASDHKRRSIFAVKGSLCLLVEDRSNANFLYCRVWLMKEYGVAESWTAQSRIAFYRMCRIIGLTVGGNIISWQPATHSCDGRWKFGSYDPVTYVNRYYGQVHGKPTFVTSLEPSLELLHLRKSN